MNTYKMSQFLIEKRKSHNYTQKDIANLCNVSTQAVSKWERGDSIPDILILERLSKLYGLSINDLINGEIKIDKHKNDTYIVSLTMSILVFCAYLFNFASDVYGGIRVLFKGYELIFNGTSGFVVIVSWLIFLILVSYLLINIFVITHVVKANKIMNIYIWISGTTSVSITLLILLLNEYILFPHLLIIISIVVQMVVYKIDITAIKKVFARLKENPENLIERKLYKCIYFGLFICIQAFILVFIVSFYTADVVSSDIFSMILVTVGWGILTYASIKLFKRIDKSGFRYQLIKLSGALLIDLVMYAFVYDAMGYQSIQSCIVLLIVLLLITIIYVVVFSRNKSYH